MKIIVLGSRSFLGRELSLFLQKRNFLIINFDKQIEIIDIINLNNENFLKKYFFEFPNNAKAIINYIYFHKTNDFKWNCFCENFQVKPSPPKFLGVLMGMFQVTGSQSSFYCSLCRHEIGSIEFFPSGKMFFFRKRTAQSGWFIGRLRNNENPFRFLVHVCTPSQTTRRHRDYLSVSPWVWAMASSSPDSKSVRVATVHIRAVEWGRGSVLNQCKRYTMILVWF